MEETAQTNNPQQINQPIQPPVENPVPVQLNEKPKRNLGLTFILSFTTIIATLIAGFFYFQNMQLRSELQKNLPSLTPTPTATPNETTDWKTYSNSDDKYSFKHPSNWNTLDMGQNVLMVAPQEDIDKVNKMLESGGGFGGGDFLIMLINPLTEKPLIVTDEYQSVKESKIVISSIDASKFEITYLQSLPGIEKGKTHVSVVVPTNKKYLKISLLEQKYLDTFNLILSTFKFNENTNSLSFECKNTKLNISFVLPNNSWNCNIDDQILIMKSDLFTITNSDEGRGPACSIGEPGSENGGCLITTFFKDELMNLNSYVINGQNKEIFGTTNIKNLYSQNSLNWVSIVYDDMGNTQLTEKQKNELLEILKSAKSIN